MVIVGGGFAGMTCARRLERELDADWDVFLLSRSNLLTYNPLLPEVVGGSLLPGHAVAPLRLMLSRTRIRMVTVNDIDVTAQTVAYSGVVDGTLRYDHLVLTMGMAANMGLVPGMDVNALPLKTIGDALHLRNQLLRRMEEATLTVDATRRAWLMTFVVIGGGFSGVETAGEIVDFVGSAYRYYRNLVREDVRVILVHDGERLLPALPSTLGAYALESLRRRGVDIRLNARAESVHSGVVRLRDGDQLTAATVVSTIGVAPHRFVVASNLPMDHGRVLTLPTLNVPGFDNVWAAGDCASIVSAHDGSLCPPTAQLAVSQARHVTANILAKIRARKMTSYSYRPIGQLASVGHRTAVAQIYGWRMRGFAAWLLWRAVYLLKMPTTAAKVRLFLEWTWAMCFPRDLSYLDFERTQKCSNEVAASDQAEAAAMANAP